MRKFFKKFRQNLAPLIATSGTLSISNQSLITGKDPEEVPASTELSQQISRALKKRGFKFLGATTVYSFLQAAGLVNDHLETCQYK